MSEKNEITFEFGVMSSKYSVTAKNKLTAYCAMLFHYQEKPQLVVIYSPEKYKEDSWTNFDGRTEAILNELFSEFGGYESYMKDNIQIIKKAIKTIKKIV